MPTALENARTNLDVAQRTFAAASTDLNARLDAAQSLDDVQAIETEIATAEAPVKKARAQFEKLERVEEARRNLGKLATPDDDGRISVTREPRTYNPTTGPSFLADLYAAQRTQDKGALERLQRNNAEVRESLPAEARASLTTTDFYRPLYLADQWVPTYRPRMVYAGLVKQLPLATWGESVSIPKYTAPTDSANFQAGDNAAITSNAGTTSQLTTVVALAAGQLDVARQAIERAAPGLDEVVFSDISRDIARKIELGCLNGSGSNQPLGILNDSNVPAVTVSGQTIAQFLLKVADLTQRIEVAVGEPADFILMHSRRFAWLSSLVDASTNRPVVVPTGQGPYNAFGIVNAPDRGDDGLSLSPDVYPMGYMLGIPIYTSPSIGTTSGSGTNEDWCLVGVRSLAVRWSDPAGIRTFAWEAVSSATASIRLQALTYSAYIHRIPTAFGVVKGLTTPTF